MKEIIKAGKQKFTAICSKCGCEFSYELSDISGRGVYCPECDAFVTHPDQSIVTQEENAQQLRSNWSY